METNETIDLRAELTRLAEADPDPDRAVAMRRAATEIQRLRSAISWYADPDQVGLIRPLVAPWESRA